MSRPERSLAVPGAAARMRGNAAPAAAGTRRARASASAMALILGSVLLELSALGFTSRGTICTIRMENSELDSEVMCEMLYTSNSWR